MLPPSPADADARRRHHAPPFRAPDAADPPAQDAVSVGERVLEEMSETLARWFGPYGYHALLTRALVRAQVSHPALAGVAVRAPLTPVLDGLSAATEVHGVGAVTVGVAAVVAGIVDLLGRMIGEDLARQLTTPRLDPPGSGAPASGAPASGAPASASRPTLLREPGAADV